MINYKWSFIQHVIKIIFIRIQLYFLQHTRVVRERKKHRKMQIFVIWECNLVLSKPQWIDVLVYVYIHAFICTHIHVKVCIMYMYVTFWHLFINAYSYERSCLTLNVNLKSYCIFSYLLELFALLHTETIHFYVYVCIYNPYRFHDEEHANLLNAMWLIAITFLSVGFGDIVPNTYCGRGIAVSTGIMVSAAATYVYKKIKRKIRKYIWKNSYLGLSVGTY